LDKTVNLRARREDVADTLSLPREYSLSENLTRHNVEIRNIVDPSKIGKWQ